MTVGEVAFVACVACCVVGHVAILMSVARRRAEPVDAGVPRPRFASELLWAILPALVLAIVLTATWARVRDAAPEKPGVLMKIAR